MAPWLTLLLVDVASLTIINVSSKSILFRLISSLLTWLRHDINANPIAFPVFSFAGNSMLQDSSKYRVVLSPNNSP